LFRIDQSPARAAQALDTLSLEMLGRAAADHRFPAAERSFRLDRLGGEYLRHGQISKWQDLEQEADRIEGREGGLYLLTGVRLAGLADSAVVERQERLMSRASYPDGASYLSNLRNPG
jgi:hypothetical protein